MGDYQLAESKVGAAAAARFPFTLQLKDRLRSLY